MTVDMKITNNTLSLEQQFILDFSKKTLSDAEITLFEKYINKLNWKTVFELANNHKVANLLFYNIKKYCKDSLYNEFDAQTYELIKEQNEARNNYIYTQFGILINQLNNSGIRVCPVKGIYLIDNVFEDRSIRAMNDIDILFKKRDKAIIKSVLSENGFSSGFFENGKVIPLDIKLRNIWKLKSYNLPPFVKPVQNEFVKFIKLDFSSALDFSLDTAPVEEMIENSTFNGMYYQLLSEHYFIHLCTHLYREASNTPWIKTNKDLLIIKFCDVREFIIKKMNSESMDNAILFAKKHNIEKAIYYTIYYLDLIFNESWASEILTKLSVADEEFLHSYINSDFSQEQKRRKNFWDSLFAKSNIDELDDSANVYS